MYKKNKNGKSILIVVCVIVVCILCSSFFILNNTGFGGFFVRDGVMGVSNILKFPFSFLKNKEVCDENVLLKKEIERLKAYEYENIELKKEISDLENTLSISKSLSDKQYINSSVVNRNLGYWTEKLTIDKGRNDSVDNNMAVISKGSLIGITSNVSQFSSDVILLCNSKFPMNISVKISVDDREYYGILNNYSNGEYDIVGVVENVNIPKDSKVTTTGLGSTFPSGIFIGKVTDVVTDNFDLSKVVHVKPGVDFDDIEYVSVLKRGKE